MTSRERVVAFRVAAHGLAERRADPVGAAAAGVRDVPAGAAALALAARSDGVALDALLAQGALVRVWSLRGAAHVVPAGDLAVFTRGLLPPDERALRVFLAGAGEDALEHSGRTRTEALAETRAAIAAALAGGPLTRDALHAELRRRLPPELLMWCSRCGTRHSPPKLWRAAALDGTYVFGPPAGRRPTFVLAADPAGRPDLDACAAALARRFLRFHAPATAAGLGAWAGIAEDQARRMLALLGDEVVAAGPKGVVLGSDAAALADPPRARGVRLLPPGDPLLAAPDRATLAPDAALRRALWRPAGGPGAVLLDGTVRGTWRARRTGPTLRIEATVRGGEPLAAEARRVADQRGADSVELVVP